MYKNNSRDSSKLRYCSTLQLYCNLKGMKPAIGYYSYTKRYVKKGKKKRIIMKNCTKYIYTQKLGVSPKFLVDLLVISPNMFGDTFISRNIVNS